MTVDVVAISQARLRDWIRDCVNDHATPVLLIAVGHDERAGEIHAYRTEDGPSDRELGLLVADVAEGLLRSPL